MNDRRTSNEGSKQLGSIGNLDSGSKVNDPQVFWEAGLFLFFSVHVLFFPFRKKTTKTDVLTAGA